MKTFIALIALITVAAAAYFGHNYTQTYLGKEAIKALSFPKYTMQDGLELAKSENKLVLADYSAIWCPTCRRLDKEVFADETVSKTISDRFVYVRLEYDSKDGVAFAKKHDLQGFPRIIVLDTAGEKIVQMPLIFDPMEYAANLMNVVQLGEPAE
ncbi:MAG: thioredoxin family protein [Pseudomonadota bacterium]